MTEIYKALVACILAVAAIINLVVMITRKRRGLSLDENAWNAIIIAIMIVLNNTIFE